VYATGEKPRSVDLFENMRDEEYSQQHLIVLIFRCMRKLLVFLSYHGARV
jgi:hypothetical protein